jgi:hypothetical protein
MAISSSSTVDGQLTFTVAPEDFANLRLLATSDPSWKWSSSSSGTSLAAATTDGTPPTLQGTGDVDIWLEAGKSILIEIKTNGTSAGPG